ncbi:hypothetical protein NE237_001235 [Protea cynaroides]|uniref:Uncharacterized protein n=1 Tax=Protea cynaroides TaxID=273540 RepID=A0A9Q0KT46_9MAGN|nr:hypothetical protein NE237_001235 [Protea cynaroides]
MSQLNFMEKRLMVIVHNPSSLPPFLIKKFSSASICQANRKPKVHCSSGKPKFHCLLGRSSSLLNNPATPTLVALAPILLHRSDLLVPTLLWFTRLLTINKIPEQATSSDQVADMYRAQKLNVLTRMKMRTKMISAHDFIFLNSL